MVIEVKLLSVDGYTIIDVPGSAFTVGPIRSAKKVLRRTSIDLARHATYVCAVQRFDAVGAVAAVNFDRASEDPNPFTAFSDELATWAKATNFVGCAALGLSVEEAGPALHSSVAKNVEMAALSAAACTPPNAQTFAVVSDGEEPALKAILGERQLDVHPDLATGLASGVDVLFVRGKTGVLDHAVLEDANVKVIIALQPLTTTARGLAVAGRAGVTIMPDFVSASGPVLAALGLTPDEIVTQTRAAISRAVIERETNFGIDMFVKMSEMAEDHLRTGTEQLPFGRPLAP